MHFPKTIDNIVLVLYYISMKNTDILSEIETRLATGLSLLEIIKDYCKYNYETPTDLSKLIPVMEILIDNQKIISNKFDTISDC